MLGSREDPDLLNKFEVAAGVLDERACLLRQIMDNPAPGEHQLEHEQGLVKQGRQTASVAVPSFMHIKSLAHLEEYASTLAEIDTPEDLLHPGNMLHKLFSRRTKKQFATSGEQQLI